MRLVLATILALVVVLPPPFWGRAEAGGGIVSVGGAVTEIVYALGQEDRLLAVDTTSLYPAATGELRSEEHTSELQSLMRISYAVFCLKKKNMQLTCKQNNSLNILRCAV